MQRYSKKRQAIIGCLAGTTTHPSAEWIYEKLKPDFPDLSLATVYRNLRELLAAGEIISVGTVDGHERFDKNTSPHVHAICRRCGRVSDVWQTSVPAEAADAAAAEAHFSDAVPCFQITGICEECAAECGI